MNALVPTLTFSAQEHSLIRKTTAKDASDIEFDWFVAFCRTARLNPLRKQCYLFIYNKNNPAKRQPVIVTAIDGLRAIADRTGNYRPDELAPRFMYDESLKSPLNPAGLVKAEVSVNKFSHGAWFPTVGEARWEEFAPVRHVWAEDETGKRVRTNRQELDPSKEGWTRMPHLMLAKCAEAQALRRAWPEDLSGLYGEEEVDKMRTIELTATEIANEADKTARLDRVGGPKAITIDWMDGKELQRVPAGKFYDQAEAFIAAQEKAAHVVAWRDRNRHSLAEFWALEKDAALALKKIIEPIEEAAKAAAKKETK